ncbi:hypothetical protein B0H12DRAFT_1136838 [Mycena haematopus]|nr:hypothetical protein B0H12DRAFT_1136838 [Mycena haematopus]
MNTGKLAEDNNPTLHSFSLPIQLRTSLPPSYLHRSRSSNFGTWPGASKTLSFRKCHHAELKGSCENLLGSRPATRRTGFWEYHPARQSIHVGLPAAIVSAVWRQVRGSPWVSFTRAPSSHQKLCAPPVRVQPFATNVGTHIVSQLATDVDHMEDGAMTQQTSRSDENLLHCAFSFLNRT